MSYTRKVVYICIGILILLMVSAIYLDFNVKVCEVEYIKSHDDTVGLYNQLTETNYNGDISIVRIQMSTGGTTYRIEQSTNSELITANNDIVLSNWIDPRNLKINNDFTMDGAVEFIIMSKAEKHRRTYMIDGENVPVIKPLKVIMLTKSDKIINAAENSEFRLKDVSFAGHVIYYLRFVIPALKYIMII